MGKNEVVVKFLGDSSGFEKAAAQVVAKLGLTQNKMVAAGVGAAGVGIAAGAALFKVGEQFDAVFDHIRVGTGATGEKLKGLEGDFKQVVKDVPTDFTSAGNAIAFVASKMDATGATGRALSEQFLELSRVTGTDLMTNMQSATDALNLFNVPAKFAPNFIDQMFRASQKSGVAFADIASGVAEAATTLKPFGFTLGQTTALVASLGKSGLSTSDVMPALGKALAKAAKEGVPAYKFLQDTFAAIKAAPDDTKAAGTAMEVFGAKAGPKFAGLIRAGKLDFDAMMRSIGEGKDTVRKAGKDTEDFAEKWTKVKNQVFVAIQPIATKLFDAVGNLADKFSNLSPGMQQAIIAGVALVAVIGGIGAAITVLTPVVAAIGVAIGVLTSPITLVIAAVALAAILIVKNWDKIKNAVGSAASWIGDKISGLVGFFTGMPGKIAKATSGMFDGIKNAFKTAVNFIIRGWNRIQFKIPGFKIGPVGFSGFTLGLPNIPYLAKGGTAVRGGAAIVGEEGPELLNLPTGASVIPLNRGGSDQPVTIVLEIDGYAFARATVPHTRSELLRVKARSGDLGFV